MVDLSDAPARVEFGRFRVVPHRRQLLADGRPVRLGGRAFDVLMALIEASGAVVSKDELLDRVWQGRIVDENRLAGEITALRKAFGAERELIRTVAGRGYQFTGEIRAPSGGPGAPRLSESAAAGAELRRPLRNLPESVSELIGREVELAELTDLAATNRLVTLIGPGGIGKTRLGFELARQLLPELPDGVWVAELGPLSDPALVPVTVAMALRLDLSGGVISAERVADALGANRLMLLLDNCEHLIIAAAGMAEALLRASSAARVLATSREPLRVEGECLYRVPPLAMPPAGIEDVDELMRHGSVRLFIARARTANRRFSQSRRGAAATAAICRRLDGIPLAIELAAARSAALGTAEVASRLDDRFRLLTDGLRTALPRHQTLRATLDWSYELLPEPERRVLRCLAIFAGSFTLAAASAIAANDPITPSEVVDGVARLITKSLVVADRNNAVVHYRLLETTRAYALEKLVESGEANAVARRHADYYREFLQSVETGAEPDTNTAGDQLAAYRREIDNLRTALDWAFSPNGDQSIAVALTVASIPLWMHLSLMEECRGRVERALSLLQAAQSRDERCEMHLYSALGSSLPYTTGVASEIGAAWERALKIAQELDDPEYRLRALWGLWDVHVIDGEYWLAFEFAQKFRALAEQRAVLDDRLIADRLIGLTRHYLGDQPGARCHLERMLSRYVVPVRSDIIRFRSDQRVQARVCLARVLWLLGMPDQAVRTAQSCVADARAIDHAISRCYALALAACPVAFWVGDLPAVERYTRMLLDDSTRHRLVIWHPWGRSFEGSLLIERGDAIAGLQYLRAGLDEHGGPSLAARFLTFQGILADALSRVGQVSQGLAALDEGLDWSHRTEGRWAVAELLRIKGELLLSQGGSAAAIAAEDHFRQALDWARRQGALSWELRAATSLARRWWRQGRGKEGFELLAPVYDRFTEGFETADLRSAKALTVTLR